MYFKKMHIINQETSFKSIVHKAHVIHTMWWHTRGVPVQRQIAISTGTTELSDKRKKKNNTNEYLIKALILWHSPEWSICIQITNQQCVTMPTWCDQTLTIQVRLWLIHHKKEMWHSLSGKILAWNPFPKNRFSRLLNACRERWGKSLSHSACTTI